MKNSLSHQARRYFFDIEWRFILGLFWKIFLPIKRRLWIDLKATLLKYKYGLTKVFKNSLGRLFMLNIM